MASIPPRMHPHSVTMDDRFHVWQSQNGEKTRRAQVVHAILASTCKAIEMGK